MRTLTALLLFLPGCASVLGSAPTFEYCDNISYVRKGNQIDVVAHCNAPIGGGSLAIPAVK